MRRANAKLVAIFCAPLLLATVSLVGLVGALLADGAWDGLGAGLLATTMLAVLWARLRRRDQDRRG